MSLRAAFVLTTGLLTGCATTTQIVEKPVCDPACQKALALSDVAQTLAQIKDPKTGGVDPSSAALILRMYRSSENEDIRAGIENGLKKQDMKIAGTNCLTLRDPKTGAYTLLCPKQTPPAATPGSF